MRNLMAPFLDAHVHEHQEQLQDNISSYDLRSIRQFSPKLNIPTSYEKHYLMIRH
jgi:hypothetical protein